MPRKFLSALMLSFSLIALSLMVVSADPPKPGDKSQPQVTKTPPGLGKNPSADKSKDKDKDKDKGPHGAFGTVTTKGAQSFIITTKQGEAVTVLVMANTRFHIPTKKDASFSDLNVNDSVAVNGTPTSNGLEAKKVGIVPGKPSIQHRVGIVKSYTAGTSITIEDIKGGAATFQLTKETEIRSPQNAGVKIGDRVTIVSRRDPSPNVFTARAIVVHGH
ncbi:MAG: hypothetical protein HZB51_12085 [Chloroflexi bacterium]|nr:hypothetical protein [Chloroflexota bacterium]